MKVVLGVRDVLTRPYFNTSATVCDGREVNVGAGPFYARFIVGRFKNRSERWLSKRLNETFGVDR